MKRFRKITAYVLGGALVVILGILMTKVYLYRDRNCDDHVVDGKATIGGPFALTDYRGHQITNIDLLGQPYLIYFGFTRCPEICPTDVANLSDAVYLLDDDGVNITPVFVTIDPIYDTNEELKDFMAYFHPRFYALRGTNEETNRIKSAYRVYAAFAKREEEEKAPMMNHSALVYLMNSQGDYLAHFPQGSSSEDIAKRTACYIS